MEAALARSFNATYLEFYRGPEDIAFCITGNYGAKLWMIKSLINKTWIGPAKYEDMKVTAEPGRMFATKVVVQNGRVQLSIDNQSFNFVLPLPARPITMAVVNGDFNLYKAEARTLSRCQNAEYCLVRTVRNDIGDYVSQIVGKSNMRSLAFVTEYKVNGKWKLQRTVNMTVPIQKGRMFNVTAVLKDGKVKATVDNQIIYDVLPVGYKPITKVSIRGLFALYSMNVTTLTYANSRDTKDSLERRRPNGVISEIAEVNEKRYLALPYRAHFAKFGKSLLFSMQVSLLPNAKVTLIDVYSNFDIVWHIRGDYANSRWVLNSWIDKKWEKDRYEQMKIAKVDGRLFNVTIKIEDGKVITTIDNQTIVDNVAQRDYPVTSVNVVGDFFLHGAEAVVLKEDPIMTEREKARIESFIRERNPFLENGVPSGLNLALPFWLPFKLPSATQFLFMQTSLKPKPYSTIIDFYVGDAIVWHFRGYYDSKLWVLNWKRKSLWQGQRYFQMSVDHTAGKTFNVTVIMNGGYVEARFGNQTIYDFRDLPDKPLTGALIHGDFLLQKAIVLPMESNYVPRSDDADENAGRQKRLVEMEWMKVKPLSLPITTKFEEPQYKQILYLQVSLKPNPRHSLIQFYANENLVWYIRGVYENKTWVLNSQIENDLPVKRYRKMEIAVGQERIFNVTVALDGMNVKATIDNQTIYDIVDLTVPVTSVTVDGDFTLYEINTGKVERDPLATKRGVPGTDNTQPAAHPKEARENKNRLKQTEKQWMLPPVPETKEGSDERMVLLKLQELPGAKEFEVDLEAADGKLWTIRIVLEKETWTVGSLVKGVWRRNSSGILKFPLKVAGGFPVKLRKQNGTILAFVDKIGNNLKLQLPEKVLQRVSVKGDVIAREARLLQRLNDEVTNRSIDPHCEDGRILEAGESLMLVAIADDSAPSNKTKAISAIVKLKPEAKRFHMKVSMNDGNAWRLVADLDKDEWNYSTLIDETWVNRGSFKSSIRLADKGVFSLRSVMGNDSVEFYLDDRKVTPWYSMPGSFAKHVELSGDVEKRLVSVENLPSTAQSNEIVWHDDDEIEINERREELMSKELQKQAEDSSRISKSNGVMSGKNMRQAFGMRNVSSVKEWLLPPTPKELRTNDTGREIFVKFEPLPETKRFDLDLEINETVAWTMRVDLEKNTFTCGVLVEGKWHKKFLTALGKPLKVGSASVVKLKLENGTVQVFLSGTTKSPKVTLPGETVHHVALIGNVVSHGARSKLFSQSEQQLKKSLESESPQEEVDGSDDLMEWEAAEPLLPILVTNTTESSNATKTVTAVGKVKDKGKLIRVDLKMDSGSASRFQLDLTSNDWYFNTFADNVWEKRGPFKSPISLAGGDAFKLEARMKDGVAELYLNERKLSPSYRLPGRIVQKATMSGDIQGRSITIEDLEWMSQTEETIWHFAGVDSKVQSEQEKTEQNLSKEQESSPKMTGHQHYVPAHQQKKFGLLVGIVARFILKPDAKKFQLYLETDDNKAWRLYAPLGSKDWMFGTFANGTWQKQKHFEGPKLKAGQEFLFNLFVNDGIATVYVDTHEMPVKYELPGLTAKRFIVDDVTNNSYSKMRLESMITSSKQILRNDEQSTTTEEASGGSLSRPNTQVCTLSTLINGVWQKEMSFKSNVSLATQETLKLSAKIDDRFVQIFFGNKSISPKYEVLGKTVEEVLAEGDVETYSIKVAHYRWEEKQPVGTDHPLENSLKSQGDGREFSDSEFALAPASYKFLRAIRITIGLNYIAKKFRVDVIMDQQTIWRLDANMQSREWMLSSRINGAWKKQVKFNCFVPLAGGNVFHLTASVEDGFANLLLNNRTVLSKYSLPGRFAKNVTVSGDIVSYSVDLEHAKGVLVPSDENVQTTYSGKNKNKLPNRSGDSGSRPEWTFSLMVNGLWKKPLTFKHDRLDEKTKTLNALVTIERDFVQVTLDNRTVSPKYPMPKLHSLCVFVKGDVSKYSVLALLQKWKKGSPDNASRQGMKKLTPATSEKVSLSEKRKNDIMAFKWNSTTVSMLYAIVTLKPVQQLIIFYAEMDKGAAWTFQIDTVTQTAIFRLRLNGAWQTAMKFENALPPNYARNFTFIAVVENGTIEFTVFGKKIKPEVFLPARVFNNLWIDGADIKFTWHSIYWKKTLMTSRNRDGSFSQYDVGPDDFIRVAMKFPLPSVDGRKNNIRLLQSIVANMKLKEKRNKLFMKLKFDNGAIWRLDIHLSTGKWTAKSTAGDVRSVELKTETHFLATSTFNLTANVEYGVAQIYLNGKQVATRFPLPGEIVEATTFGGEIEKCEISTVSLNEITLNGRWYESIPLEYGTVPYRFLENNLITGIYGIPIKANLHFLYDPPLNLSNRESTVDIFLTIKLAPAARNFQIDMEIDDSSKMRLQFNVVTNKWVLTSFIGGVWSRNISLQNYMDLSQQESLTLAAAIRNDVVMFLLAGQRISSVYQLPGKILRGIAADGDLLSCQVRTVQWKGFEFYKTVKMLNDVPPIARRLLQSMEYAKPSEVF
ncbi:hypothetical protein TTRE_0000047401 [Trichuris trichiura]|uniref:Uncharacterized protein n=1 Tax=Trichuris trichiura TaxID=36087 RepID=A0A077Z0U1_TRITR|nr:hypothetical protein TTRE_0000047401 [Trichuris trichiura]